ncbi:AAA family ATPase [Agrobacterium sp. MOPV5]|uniref:AAA family ATPase n=1 Tax=Agrobacterium leguminum TaxID=2792015 RepID=UPI0018C29AC5|nr:AAA family ATPase [Agrobacterium leguminum]
MKLELLKIMNFRCFGPDAEAINFEQGVTAFVGNNGAGKTAIFAALSKMFGTTAAQRQVGKRDFHLGPGVQDITSGAALSIDCLFGFPNVDQDDEDAIAEVFNNMSIGGENEPLKVRIRFEATWTDDGTPEGFVDEQMRWIHTLGDDFDWDESPRVQAAERNFIQLVYVPATRNAFDQVTSLLKGRLWKAAQWSPELTEIVSRGSEQIQQQFDRELPARFIAERLRRRWQQVDRGDTNANPALRLLDHNMSDLVRRAEFVFAGEDPFYMLGLEELSDGQRSLFHIALTAATLEIEQDALAAGDGAPFEHERLRRTYLTLLVIEEPENSLSPFFLSRIMLQAREIGGMTNAQVAIASHSASILARIEANEVRYCRLDDEMRQSSVREIILPPETTEANAYVRLAVKAYPELYFARFVILAEGDSESLVLPRLAEAMGFPIDPSFVPVVPLGGRFVRHFWRLLNGLNVPHATLLDLDLGRKHGGANAIKSVVAELARVGKNMARNQYVRSGEIDPSDMDDISDADLLDEDQDHIWLKALQKENVYFSSPIDLDFAMLQLFAGDYQVARSGGRGPRRGRQHLERKRAVTLKTDGHPQLYEDFGDSYDASFIWYPYLFLSNSKPESHIMALATIEAARLRSDAPVELRDLVDKVARTILP